jgi:hypothetical protein
MADVLLKVLDADGTAQTLVTEQSGTSDKIPVHRAQGPGGAALSTAAKQDTGNTSLAGILAASGGVDMTAVTTTAGAALNAILFTADTTNFAAVSVQILGTFVGTVTFEGSNDNVNWSTVTGNSLASGTSTTGASAPGMYRAGHGQCRAEWWRQRHRRSHFGNQPQQHGRCAHSLLSGIRCDHERQQREGHRRPDLWRHPFQYQRSYQVREAL